MLLFIQLTDINNWLWSTVLIAMLVGCALYFSVRTGFMQVRLFGEMVRAIVRPERRDSRDAHVKHISSFQAFVIALGSRVGTGNLAGVATAISLGRTRRGVLDVGDCRAGLGVGVLSNPRWRNSTSARRQVPTSADRPTICSTAWGVAGWHCCLPC